MYGSKVSQLGCYDTTAKSIFYIWPASERLSTLTFSSVINKDNKGGQTQHRHTERAPQSAVSLEADLQERKEKWSKKFFSLCMENKNIHIDKMVEKTTKLVFFFYIG